MKAACLFKEKFELEKKDGGLVVVYMDLFQVTDGTSVGLPEGYRFSWIAFDPDNPADRVLFDCHLNKGPHFHVGSGDESSPYQWKGLKEAEKDFFEKVEAHFGELTGGEQS